MPICIRVRPLLSRLDAWLKTPAARAWEGPEPAALAWTALVLRASAILTSCKLRQLQHTDTAAAAQAFACRPTLAAWRRLLQLRALQPQTQRLAAALQDTDFSLDLLKCAPAALWLDLAHALGAAPPLTLAELEALYLSVLQRHAGARRRTFGQFYTPETLVEKMWRLGWAQWQQLSAAPAALVDPCCGSGAFFRHPAAVTAQLPQPSRLGFELQRLPRTLARLHAWQGGGDEVILNANALDHAATQAAGPRFVVGNPPWRNPSPALQDPTLAHFLRHELMPYAWHYEGVALSSLRGCTHGVREDSVFFLGRVLQWLSPQGVAVLVTGDSWLDAPTYTLLRRYLLDTTRVHSVLRLGRYFPGVRERAAVVVLSRGYVPAGRQQRIAHADWSAGTPAWVESQWETAATPMQVDPQTCQLRPARAESPSKPGAPCMMVHQPRKTHKPRRGAPGAARHTPLHELFTRSVAGAQSGCAPLFLAADRDDLERRIERLFANDLANLAEELGAQVRGGPPQAQALLQRVGAARDAHGTKRVLRSALRPIWAHFRGGRDAPARKQGWCYFDPRLWLFPRVPRLCASQRCFWDVEPKLVFRDVYDPHDKPIAGIVDAAGWVCDNHVLNGGTRVAAVRDAEGALLLTPAGRRVRRHFSSDVKFLHALARCLNGPEAQQWGHTHPREPLALDFGRLDEG